MAAGQAQKAKKGALPDVAPTEAVETVLLSEGDKGYSIPVKVRLSPLPPPSSLCLLRPSLPLPSGGT